jgi:small-conductance mechanosensitive channel
MSNRTKTGGNASLRIASLLLTLFLTAVSQFTAAQQNASTPKPPNTSDQSPAQSDRSDAEEETTPTGEVVIEGRHILTVYHPIGPSSSQQRADNIEQRIIAVAREGKVAPEAVATTPRDSWTEIIAGEKLLMVVTEKDADAAHRTRDQLAAEDAGNIRQAILNYRHEHSWRAIGRGIVYAIVATIVMVGLLWVIRKVRLAIRGVLEGWIDNRTRLQEKKTLWHVAATYLLSLFIALGVVFRWLLVIAIVESYITVVLSFFSATRSISHAITDWLLIALESLGIAALDYLPNLFVIAVVVAIASQVLRLINMVFDEIAKGNLSLRGFYPDWAPPTARLIRMLVIVLVLVIIFPYLPGSKSPAFQGISIFVGVLISLGSSSAVANAIAGIILTYMRSFLIGDWVKIGDTMGEVVEKNMLVTRILTQKQEVITIPNATVMNTSVMNFTREAKNSGVIFHTTVTIGYDAPWKTVHQLLLDAAAATQHVRKDPAPFVLQTALNDFYVAYELNAYTDVPREMQYIYSDLHQNIQDRFNEAGVEICSPHFSALRDGNTIAMPEQYIPKEYTAPSFQVSTQEGKATKAKTAE